MVLGREHQRDVSVNPHILIRSSSSVDRMKENLAVHDWVGRSIVQKWPLLQTNRGWLTRVLDLVVCQVQDFEY